ncbi:MAG: hypothetical protein IJ838_03340 [Paludibacteraceae bacterium]|nr:hypothetical protein [Paludibacteraceae bacterium]
MILQDAEPTYNDPTNADSGMTRKGIPLSAILFSSKMFRLLKVTYQTNQA